MGYRTRLHPSSRRYQTVGFPCLIKFNLKTEICKDNTKESPWKAMHLASLDKVFLFQRRRTLPPALLDLSSPRLEAHDHPRKSIQPDFPSI
jgi:hypothetical protein